MKSNVTLRWCLNKADTVTIDDYSMESLTYHNGNGPEALVTLERADEQEFEFLLDQTRELDEGQAYFIDTEGTEHEFNFQVTGPLKAIE